MKKYKRIIIIVVVLLTILVGRYILVNSNYYKLKTLYINPLRTNQIYDKYVYDEYINHVSIIYYEGNEKEVVIPSKIINKPVYSIDDSGFYGNSVVEKVTVPDTVIRIGHQAFIGNSNLKEVYLSKNITDIGPYSFDVCPKLEKIFVKKGSKTEKALKNTKFKKYIKYK